MLRGESIDTDNPLVHWVRREGNFRYGGLAYYASRCNDYKILQNTPWEPIQFFNLKADPKKQSPISDKNSEEYKKLFKGMMKHIRLAGMISWQNNRYK